MNKAELVDLMSKESSLSRKDSEKSLNSLIDIIKDKLKNHEKISLVGFGTFQVMTRKATTGINPKTKESISIPEKKVAKLKFSESINQMLNN